MTNKQQNNEIQQQILDFLKDKDKKQVIIKCDGCDYETLFYKIGFSDFEYVGLNPDNGKAVYKNKRSGIVYNHDFPTGNFKDVFPDVKEKYQKMYDDQKEHGVSPTGNKLDTPEYWQELFK